MKHIKGIIYLITNQVNGNRYVGQTYQTLQKRITKHKINKKNSYVGHAGRKYGWDNFTFKVLEDNITNIDLLNNRECFWIHELYTFVDYQCGGYNLTTGGGQCVMTEKFAENMRGEKNSWFGMTGAKSPLSKPCIIDGVEYPGLSEAARILNKGTSTIRRWINEGSPHNAHYVGATHVEYNPTPKCKPCVVDGIEYVSVNEASIAHGEYAQTFQRRCHNPSEKFSNYYFI